MENKWIVRVNGEFEKIPAIGSKCVVKYIAGSEHEYGLFDVTSTYIQSACIGDNVEGWQYVDEFMPKTSTKNILSGFKEGVDNDWAPTNKGYIEIEKDIKMLRQQVNARLQTLPNEVDDFDGIDYMNIIFGGTSVDQKAAALVNVIQNIPTVKNVTFISASWINKASGTFKFTFNIQSIFGDLQFNLGLDAQNKKVIAENE